jgi:hypothetical protein
MYALGATLTLGALAPTEAAAQLSGRERSGSADRRGGVVVPQTDRRDGRWDDRNRRDDRCYEDRDDRRRRLEEEYWRDRRKLDEKYRDRLRRLESRRNDRSYRSEYDRLKRDWERDRERFDREYRYNRDRDRNDRWDDCDDDDRRSGPAFCRNGQGHPVYGMSWCRQKGWERASLRNTGWSDVVLRRPRYGAQADLGRNVLLDILGSGVYNRFDSQRARLGANGGLTGRWSDTSNGSVLDLLS